MTEQGERTNVAHEKREPTLSGSFQALGAAILQPLTDLGARFVRAWEVYGDVQSAEQELRALGVRPERMPQVREAAQKLAETTPMGYAEALRAIGRLVDYKPPIEVKGFGLKIELPDITRKLLATGGLIATPPPAVGKIITDGMLSGYSYRTMPTYDQLIQGDEVKQNERDDYELSLDADNTSQVIQWREKAEKWDALHEGGTKLLFLFDGFGEDAEAGIHWLGKTQMAALAPGNSDERVRNAILRALLEGALSDLDRDEAMSTVPAWSDPTPVGSAGHGLLIGTNEV